MFGTIVEKIQSLLSRSFLLGSFFPVVIFAAINFAILWTGIDGFADTVTANFPKDATAASTAFGFVLVGLALLSFILNPLVPVFRGALEGNILPKKVRDELVGYYTRQFNALEGARRTAGRRLTELTLARKNAENELGLARNDAVAVREAANKGPFEDAVVRYEGFLAEIAARESHEDYIARLPEPALATNTIHSLAAALRHYPMKISVAGFDQAIFNRLNQIHFDLLGKLDGLRDIAYSALQDADSKCRYRFVAGGTRATPLANSRAAMEHYSHVAYNADFDFLWPRIRMVLSKDATIAGAVETAAAQLDFAILMTALTALSTLIWTILLPIVGKSVILYAVTVLLGPPLVVFFYRLVDASQQAFGAVTMMAIDGLRFELLRALHIPLPASINAEQKLWEGLQLALNSAPDGDVFYRHPKL